MTFPMLNIIDWEIIQCRSKFVFHFSYVDFVDLKLPPITSLILHYTCLSKSGNCVLPR
jgi:hypothetical protein